MGQFLQIRHIIDLGSFFQQRNPRLPLWFPDQDFCLVSELDGWREEHSVSAFWSCAAVEIFRVS